MSTDKQYNWWKDPANAEVVKNMSWWDNPDNMDYIQIPVALFETLGHWHCTCSSETEKLLGPDLCCFSIQEESREKSIEQFFKMIRIVSHHNRDEAMRFQRWVPFRCSKPNKLGFKSYWFTVFGMHFSIRVSKKAKGGLFIPFTNVNISFHNEWKTYNRWKKENIFINFTPIEDKTSTT